MLAHIPVGITNLTFLLSCFMCDLSPSSDNNALIEHLTSKLDIAPSLYPNAGIFLIGDFN